MNPPQTPDSDAPSPPFAQHALGIPRPPSVGGISSRVTDMSDDGENSQTFTGGSQRGSQTYTGAPSSHPPQSQPSVSRRGPPPARSSVITSISQATSNRPGSSGSRLSRTHIPSLTAQGFFRPMSSQRLQAHRGRPVTKGATESSTEDWDDDATQNRRSFVSNSTLPQSSIPQEEVPPSRGTEFTDPIIPDRNDSNASPTGNTTTARSLGESARLLHERERANRPTPAHLNLNLAANYNNASNHETPPRSSLSFLSLQNRSLRPEHRDGRPHERLSSAGSSPGSLEKQNRTVNKGGQGKNYEYFTGNTIFCGGGRLQNSRDKPVNIATGIFVLAPSALFFAFS